MPGVQRVVAYHAAGIVVVDHAAEIFEEQIRATLHEMGFDVQGHSDEQETPA